MQRKVELALEQGGILRVSLLPRSTRDGTLRDLRDDPDRDRTLEPVQLMEGVEYRYEFLLPDAPADAVVTTDRDKEIFEPDTPEGRTGRLRPRLYTGMLPVTAYLDGQRIGRVAFEVRSWKFDYLSHYRWMLRDIADSLTEAVMERFAPTEQRFAPEESRDAVTLYQRFALLRSLIQSDSFMVAIQQILTRPHRAWVEEEDWRLPGQGIAFGSAIGRQFNRPGRRAEWPAGTVPALPARMQAFRTVETLNTEENRFVRFALTHWRDLVAEIDQALAAGPNSGPVERGRREAADLLEYLDSLLSAHIFQDVGIMTRLPVGSQVLQKRAGYRDLFRAYLQVEMAALLQWDGGEDVYSAGQRNVAALYEFWVFMQLSDVIATRCPQGLDREELFEVREDGLGVRLKRGRQRLLKGVAVRHGRRLHVELWFNRSFGTGEGGTSWTRPMRPDCSLCIRVENAEPDEIWLHFDAKYRVNNLRELFGQKSETPEEEEAYLADEQRAEDVGTVKRTDLLKMHAYRDAIRQSAGAYVMYPGEKKEDFKLFHEILPGLGAFALRPTDHGDAEGTDVLANFLDDVLDHVASQATQHERDRYWRRISYDPDSRVNRAVPAVPFLKRPAADTTVLLGYVKSQEHLDWIHVHHLYNLRAGGRRRGSVAPGARELGADMLVLYGPVLDSPEFWRITDGPEVMTRLELLALGYPGPGGELYHGLTVEPIPVDQWPGGVSDVRVRALYEARRPGAEPGEPVVATWLDLVR